MLLNGTWHWMEGNHGPRLAPTIHPDATKVGGGTTEITNAPVVGEDSVAEGTWYASRKQRDGSTAMPVSTTTRWRPGPSYYSNAY
ncbi:hypothetical protein ACIQ9P_08715 [Kitasatospora sp. NPDC094019]|uniref:hypothetical protein n=1 Tax=Kitasatospora sp. NPDC094019 TaxID=3364091 RepID=UPI0038076118